MRIFVYEHTCAGGATEAPSLRRLRTEGWAMLAAVLEDFERIPDVELVTLLDRHSPLPRIHSSLAHVRVESDRSAFQELAGVADYTLLIAPECGAILWTLSQQVGAAGGRLLGSSPDAVQLTGDKLTLSRFLRARALPTPECLPYFSGASIPAEWFPVVWKPRDGAGSTATFVVRGPEAFASCVAVARAEGWEGESIVQPLVRGQPASVAVIAGSQTISLLPAAQELTQDGRFHYLGGTIPLPQSLARRAVALALKAVAAIPGLQGYVGVDLVLGEANDGSQDWVIEINPRLTTSYVGLRALARENLAEVMLNVVMGRTVPPLQWRDELVRFHADGSIDPVQRLDGTQGADCLAKNARRPC